VTTQRETIPEGSAVTLISSARSSSAPDWSVSAPQSPSDPSPAQSYPRFPVSMFQPIGPNLPQTANKREAHRAILYTMATRTRTTSNCFITSPSRATGILCASGGAHNGHGHPSRPSPHHRSGMTGGQSITNPDASLGLNPGSSVCKLARRAYRHKSRRGPFCRRGPCRQERMPWCGQSPSVASRRV